MKLEKAKAELAENIFNANAEAKIQKVIQKDLRIKMDENSNLVDSLQKLKVENKQQKQEIKSSANFLKEKDLEICDLKAKKENVEKRLIETKIKLEKEEVIEPSSKSLISCPPQLHPIFLADR